MSDTVAAEAPAGRLRGRANGGVLTFRNVPYARAERFRPPEPAKPWTGERDAVSRGPVCPQSPGRLAFMIGDVVAGMVQSEDCLNLTIHTPGLTGRRPVMVWIHGGAYMFGGGEMPQSDAQKLAAEGGVVVVAISYRLGAFGYLWQGDPGRRNLGLLDQLAALDWVAANIERFGGDPDNITTVGQSAGGHSIAAMLRVRAGARPFRRAILQSTPFASEIPRDAAAGLADGFHAALGQDADAAPVAAILGAFGKALAALRTAPPVGPVLDEAGPGDRRGLEALVGWARDDAVSLVALGWQGAEPPRRWFGDQDPGPSSAKLTRAIFEAPAEAFAAATPADGKTYLYRIDLEPEGSPFGASHCADLPLLFGDEPAWRGVPFLGTEPWNNIELLGRRARAAWTAFATTGDPATDGGWDWRAHSGGTAGVTTPLAP